MYSYSTLLVVFGVDGAPVFASSRRKVGSRRKKSAITSSRRQVSIPPSDADVAKLKAQAHVVDFTDTDCGANVIAFKMFFKDGVVVATAADMALMLDVYNISKSVFDCMLRNADVHVRDSRQSGRACDA